MASFLTPEDQTAMLNEQRAADEASNAAMAAEATDRLAGFDRTKQVNDFIGNTIKGISPYVNTGVQNLIGATPEQQALRNKQLQTAELPYNIYKDISQIDPRDLQLNLERYNAVNMPTATTEVAPDMGPSAFQDVRLDPYLKQKQEADIAKFEKLGASGLTPEMLAASNKLQRSGMADFSSNLARIEQNAAARGMGSSGLSEALASQQNQQMLNKQAEAEQALQSTAFQNQLQALAQGAGLTGQMSQQDITASMNRAQGLDTSSTRQASLRADAAARNAAAINAANVRQAQNLQNIGNLNTQTAQAQQYQNVIGSRQQAADIKAKGAAGMSGAGAALRGQQQQQAQAGVNQSQAGAGVGAQMGMNLLNQGLQSFGGDIGKSIAGELGSAMPSGLDFLKSFI